MVFPDREIVRKKRFFWFSIEKIRKNVLQTITQNHAENSSIKLDIFYVVLLYYRGRVEK